MDIGYGIKKLRKEKKITQTQLSEKSGINGNYISDLENGRNNPTDKTIKKLLEPLGVSYVDFLIDYCGVRKERQLLKIPKDCPECGGESMVRFLKNKAYIDCFHRKTCCFIVNISHELDINEQIEVWNTKRKEFIPCQ